MKRFRLLSTLLAVMGLNLAVPVSAQTDGLDDVIIEYCDAVSKNVNDTLRGLKRATQDLTRCDNKLRDCTSGLFGGNPVSCFVDFGRCMVDGRTDATRECSEFGQEMAEDTRHAQNKASRLGVEEGFETWFRRAYSNSDSCLAPAKGTVVVCTASLTAE
ncbi:MAG: hypothetical protein V7720_06435 [Halioglobus sp.]